MGWKKSKVLGRGAFGKVYLATPEEYSPVHPFSMAPAVAVKSAKISRSSTLQEEASFLKKLRGKPNIIRCFGVDVSVESGKKVYNLLLEYAPGGSLLDLIMNNDGPISEPVVAYYTSMILRGIYAIHQENIIHCDLKPDNILVFPDGTSELLKIADFGLAIDASESGKSPMEYGGGRNRGTMSYASPESVVEGLHEKGCDIWALGCTVAEMVTGGEGIWPSRIDMIGLLRKIMSEKPNIPEGMSEDGKDFLERCLELEVSKRWSAEMLLDHPFIVNNLKRLHGTTADHHYSYQQINNPFGCSESWISMFDLFSSSSSESKDSPGGSDDDDDDDDSPGGLCPIIMDCVVQQRKDSHEDSIIYV